MSIICKDRRDNKVFPDFQSNPSPGTLIGNAVKYFTGKGETVTVSDFRELEVTQSEFDQHVADYKAKFESQRLADETKYNTDKSSLLTKLSTLGLTADEIRVLLREAAE